VPVQNSIRHAVAQQPFKQVPQTPDKLGHGAA
jgi:hypothetical protein